MAVTGWDPQSERLLLKTARTGLGRRLAIEASPPLQRPAENLLLLIVLGMPLIAAAEGWLLAGREPPAIAHHPPHCGPR